MSLGHTNRGKHGSICGLKYSSLNFLANHLCNLNIEAVYWSEWSSAAWTVAQLAHQDSQGYLLELSKSQNLSLCNQPLLHYFITFTVSFYTAVTLQELIRVYYESWTKIVAHVPRPEL